MVQVIVHHRRGRLIEEEFGRRSSEIVGFRESGASGQRKTPFALGGASRVLDVVVTDLVLCIKGIWPIFTAIGKQFSLTLNVPLSSIKEVSTTRARVILQLVDESGKDCTLDLRLKDPGAFKPSASGVA